MPDINHRDLNLQNFSEKINEAVDAAQEAFWAVVAQKFPEVTTGDFSPLDTVQFKTACDVAVEMWLTYNHPMLQR